VARRDLRHFPLTATDVATDERLTNLRGNIMERGSLLARSNKALLTNVAFAVLGIALMQVSHAGCGQYDPPSKSAADWRSSSPGSPRFIRADYRVDYRLVDDDEGSGWREHAKPPITGLWYFKYLSKGNTALGIPDGATLEEGNTIWFADGNEMTSSAMRAPDTGSICLGTWERTGDRTYELNHIGLSWDPVHNVTAGPAFIKQFVTLERGADQYTGVVTIIQYEADGKTIAIELKGIIVATRETVNTKTQP
jgi:hypothetical protein